MYYIYIIIHIDFVMKICVVEQTTEAGVCELSHLSFDDDRLKNYTVRTSSLYYFVALRCFGESDGGVSGSESDEEGKRSALPRVVDIDEESYEQVKQDALLMLKMQAHMNDLQERTKNDKQGYPIDVVEVHRRMFFSKHRC